MGKKIFSIIALSFLLLIVLEVFFGIVFLIKDMKEKPIIRLQESTTDYPYLYYSFKSDESNSINQDGLYTTKGRTKDPKKYRIILTGGSTARSSLAPYNETISYYLEKALNNRFDSNLIEMINAGMCGYVIEQEFIFIQLVLQHYRPDMIVGLNGYNDLSNFFEVNRFTDFDYIPPYWTDFKVIQKGKEKRLFYYRFKVLFRNIFRLVEFVKRMMKPRGFYDYSNVPDSRLEEVSQVYAGILKDIHDFCASKNIEFYSFLQPVRWYIDDGPQPVRFIHIPQFGKLYRKYEENIKSLPYCFSLTDIFEGHLDLYRDDCHVNAKGNFIFANAMADFLEERLVKDAKFQSLKNK